MILGEQLSATKDFFSIDVITIGTGRKSTEVANFIISRSRFFTASQDYRSDRLFWCIEGRE